MQYLLLIYDNERRWNDYSEAQSGAVMGQYRQLIQDICDEEGADLFISTYYTTPLTTPSVWLNRKRIVSAPLMTTPSGRARVITSVLKPPPIPPKLLPGSAIVTVFLLRGIQALVLTWTLASSAYRRP